MPFDRGPYAVRDYFRSYGIRYVIWVYKGLGMQGKNEMGSVPNSLITALEALIPMSRVLYHDDMRIVFDIG